VYIKICKWKSGKRNRSEKFCYHNVKILLLPADTQSPAENNFFLHNVIAQIKINQGNSSFARLKKKTYLCSVIKNTKKLFMYLTAEKKQEIFAKYGKSKTDTGSPEAQIALFTYRISWLTEHLKSNKKDHSTERALVMLVGKRRRLLDYLKDKDIERYRNIIKELGIRK